MRPDVGGEQIASVEWTHNEKRHRLTDMRMEPDTYGRARSVRVLSRWEGGDTGWLELARWRSNEDGPSFAGLANAMMSLLSERDDRIEELKDEVWALHGEVATLEGDV